MVMQAPNFGESHDLTCLGWLHASRHWAIHRQRQMGPPAVIIGKVAREDALEMPLVKDEHMIQTLPTDTADQALDIGVLRKN
jgi:hypothetical protein